jgi:hypothetical protein
MPNDGSGGPGSNFSGALDGDGSMGQYCGGGIARPWSAPTGVMVPPTCRSSVWWNPPWRSSAWRNSFISDDVSSDQVKN